MTRAVLIALTVASCGDNRAVRDAAIASSEPAPVAVLACTPTYGSHITTRQIVHGCAEPGAPAYPKCLAGVGVLVTSPLRDPRLFAIEQAGSIRIIDDGGIRDTPFLDITEDHGGPVWLAGELGLLGLAFHPDYATNGKFYVDFTGHNPDTTDTQHPIVDVVMEFTRSATNPDLADPTTGKVVLSIPDPFGNHNGGMIEFGSDGYLYISTGDGGSAGDPERNGQNRHALLAKILRIDVDHPSGGKAYGIPADNPWADGIDGAPEVYIYGLRNPWRWTFDRKTGAMWIADVGQNQIEELDVLPAGQQAGKNLGWSVYEGNRCCAAPESDKCNQAGTTQAPCDPTDMAFPQFQAEHKDGWIAIIGGQVYRGSCYPELDGAYIFADNGFPMLGVGRLNADGSVSVTMLPGPWPYAPTSFHADSRGEIYETTGTTGIWHIEAH